MDAGFNDKVIPKFNINTTQLMKRLKLFAVAMISLVLGTTLLSCSNEDDAIDENKKVENTTWRSVEFNSHQTTSFFTDKSESNTTVLAKMNQMSGLRYTTDESSETKDVSVNLCEKSGHTQDGLMSLAFSSGKCSIKLTTCQSVYKAKKTVTEKKYKFEEGSYIVNVGGSNYEGINVYNYGVYRANGTLFIPLDGNGCITIETTTKYTEKQIDNSDIKENTYVADYSVSGNTISFSYTDGGQSKSFSGTLSADNQEISVSYNPLFSSIKTFKK